MNYIKQVAQMLGVEIGEEFKLKGFGEVRFKLTEDGLYWLVVKSRSWQYSFSFTDILNGTYEIIKLPILDDIEKEYLSAVIKPFRNEVYFIVKVQHEDSEYIAINYRDKFSSDKFYIHLPSFKKGTMYKGMEEDKEYSLEELGL